MTDTLKPTPDWQDLKRRLDLLADRYYEWASTDNIAAVQRMIDALREASREIVTLEEQLQAATVENERQSQAWAASDSAHMREEDALRAQLAAIAAGWIRLRAWLDIAGDLHGIGRPANVGDMIAAIDRIDVSGGVSAVLPSDGAKATPKMICRNLAPGQTECGLHNLFCAYPACLVPARSDAEKK